MKPTIKIFPETKFIGKNLSFTYTDYRAFELWSSFMPRRNEIRNAIGKDLFNIQINPENFDFNPQTEFVKWAVVPVSDFDFSWIVCIDGCFAKCYYLILACYQL